MGRIGGRISSGASAAAGLLLEESAVRCLGSELAAIVPSRPAPLPEDGTRGVALVFGSAEEFSDDVLLSESVVSVVPSESESDSGLLTVATRRSNCSSLWKVVGVVALSFSEGSTSKVVSEGA